MRDPSAQPTLAQTDQPTASRLCARCAAIDFPTLFASRWDEIKLGPPASWRRLECDFCDFLVRCIFTLPLEEDETFESILGSSHTLRPDRRLENDTGLMWKLGVVERAARSDGQDRQDLWCNLSSWLRTIHILRTTVDYVPKIITAPMIDFSIVRDWLAASTEYGVAVKGDELKHSSLRMNVASRGVMTLQVIDCKSRAVIELPPGSHYATLSYVWGTRSAEQDAETEALNCAEGGLRFVPTNAPATIEDTLVVCLKLGFNYLWIDKYCIPQNDPEERQKQIYQMDKIYRNSILTLIACAGQDPHYGLPGVTRPREQNPSIVLPGFGHLQTAPHIRSIFISAWSGRGWTFQETLLSQRRLYFTDQQLYFESESINACECASPAGDHVAARHFIFSQTTWSKWPHNIYTSIEKFTVRSFSFPDDTLDALRGVLAVFDDKFRVRHISGMPYMDPHDIIFAEKRLDHCAASLQVSLLFQTDQDSVRCTHFPSWCWAGWTGRKHWANLDHGRVANLTQCCIAVEHMPNRVINWDDFQAQYHTLKHIDIKFIHIRAFVSPVVACLPAVTNSPNFPLVFELPDKIFLECDTEFNAAVSAMLASRDGGRFALIHLPYKEHLRQVDYETGAKTLHLLLRDMGTHWERMARVRGVYKAHHVCDLEPEDWPRTMRTIRLG